MKESLNFRYWEFNLMEKIFLKEESYSSALVENSYWGTARRSQWFVSEHASESCLYGCYFLIKLKEPCSDSLQLFSEKSK